MSDPRHGASASVPYPAAPAGFGPPTGYPQLNFQPPPPAPTGLALAARLAAIAVGLTSIVSLALAFPALTSYREAAARGDDALDVFTAYEVFTLVGILAQLIAFILTCLWLYECRTRVDGFAPWVPQRRSKVWVWLAWIVPVVSFWFPYQVIRDVRRGSYPHLRIGNALVGWWLAAWIAYQIADQFSAFTLPMQGEIDIATIEATLIPTQAIATAICLSALVLWWKVISDIMDGQVQLGAQAPAQPQQWPTQQA